MKPMGEIYQKHVQTVYRYLLSLVHDSDLAEELTQETFYQAIRSANKYNESCAVTTWLCAIARNVMRTYYHKHPPQENIEEHDIGVSSAENEAISTMEKVDLLRLIHRLEDPAREVMYLRLFGALSFREIGEITGHTESWARVTFYRGKEKLKKEMGKDE